jgi:hypothetical protein
VSSFFRAVRILQTSRVFSESWIVFKVFQMSVMTRILQDLGAVHIGLYKSVPAEKQAVARETFTLMFDACFEMVQDPLLQLESPSLAKVKADYVAQYGDMRSMAMRLVVQAWNELKGIERQWTSEQLVGKCLSLFTNPCTELRNSAISLFFEMVNAEFDTNGRFRTMERFTIDALEKSELLKRKDSEFKVVFGTALEPKFREAGKPKLLEQGLTFLKDIRQLLDLMVALQEFPDEPEYEDERTVASLKLMTYLSQTGRADLANYHLDSLMRMHAKLGNLLEAGFCVLRKLEQAKASNQPFTEQEKLYTQAINFLSNGKDWERAISLCRELASRYENEVYDYVKLGAMLKQQAELFIKIQDQDRFFAEYFRVGFFGMGFDEEYRDKEFIYRGGELERVGDFAGRIQRKFPKAELLKKSEPPGIVLYFYTYICPFFFFFFFSI